MSDIRGPPLLHSIPDDLTTVQFMLDTHHPCRPVRKDGLAWLVDDDSGREVHFDEIRARTDGLANALSLRFHIGYDDVVCIFSPNHINYPITIWAAHRLGAIVTPANPTYTANELASQLRITKTKLIVAHPLGYAVAVAAARAAGLSPASIVLFDPIADATPPVLGELIAEGLSVPRRFAECRLKPGEGKTKLAFLSFSSGTTGLPKAVCIPHYSLIANIVQLTCVNDADPTPWADKAMRPGDTGMAVLPFYHIYAIVTIIFWFPFYGMKTVIVPRFDFIPFLKSIERHRINAIPLVPPIVLLLCQHPAVAQHDLSSARMITIAAAPLSAERTLRLAEVLPKCHVGQGYGLTETCTVVAFPQIERRVATPGSAGRLVPGVVARVVRPDGTIAPRGELGELVVKSPSNAVGYLNEAKATQETFVDGWVRTGDEVYFDDAGDLFVVDRIKEMLKVKGFQVAPAELEGHLLDHPDVADVCVVGVPDEYTGDAPLAFVVPTPAARARIAKDPAAAHTTRAALLKHVADAKVHYKRLTGGVEFIDAIPRNASGKLLRRELRGRAREMLAKRKAAGVGAKL
ncbi:amp dependent CoA ligase [Amylocystis lapponica]|nr:amp dependent CoA ligase [Amylocystis lapponica]